jgi:hypothetical protein
MVGDASPKAEHAWARPNAAGGRASSPHGAPRSANAVNTKNGDRPFHFDDDDIRPDTSQVDWSRAEVGRRTRKPGEKVEIFIDGAVGYQLRLLPSNKVLARFDSTLEAWPVIIATVESGALRGRCLSTCSMPQGAWQRSRPARDSSDLPASPTAVPIRTNFGGRSE